MPNVIEELNKYAHKLVDQSLVEELVETSVCEMEMTCTSLQAALI